MACEGMMFPGTPARGTRSSVRAFVTEFLTISSREDTTLRSFFHVVLNVKDVFDY